MVGGGRARFRTGATRGAQRRPFALRKERRGLSRACAFLVPVGFLSTGQVATWLLFPQTLTAREKPCGVSVAESFYLVSNAMRQAAGRHFPYREIIGRTTRSLASWG